MKLLASIAALCVAAAALLPLSTLAGPGHDHGDSAPVTTGPALPRFAATSELFELVGVLNGRQITLYLDRTADNAPIFGAQIELEIGGEKLKAATHDDTYHVELATAPKPGVLPVTATVIAGQEIDLLAGELDIHDETPGGKDAHVHGWQEYAGWAGGAVVAVAALVLIGRRLAAGRQARSGASA